MNPAPARATPNPPSNPIGRWTATAPVRRVRTGIEVRHRSILDREQYLSVLRRRALVPVEAPDDGCVVDDEPLRVNLSTSQSILG